MGSNSSINLHLPEVPDVDDYRTYNALLLIHNALEILLQAVEDGMGGGGGGHEIQDEGIALAQEAALDFQGLGVTVTPGVGKTIVTIPGGTSYTDEDAQDAVGTILGNTADIDLIYNDGANTITATLSAALAALITALATASHAAASVGDTSTVDLTIVGQHITGIVPDNGITNAKLADVNTATFKGRTTGGAGDPEDLTVAQAKTLLNLAGTNNGDQTSIVGIAGTKAEFNTACSDGDFLFKDPGIVEDATPELGGDLYWNNYSGYEVHFLHIDGQTATYTDAGTPSTENFIYIGANHTYDYTVPGLGLILPSALWFSGEQRVKRNMYASSGCSLFYVDATIVNEAGVNRRLSGLNLLVGATNYTGDGGGAATTVNPATNALFAEIYSGPIWSAINSATVSANGDVHSVIVSLPTINTGVSLNSRPVLNISDYVGAGSLAKQTGLLIADLTKATDNSAIVYGTGTIPSNQFGIYQGNTKRNYFNGSMRTARRHVTSGVTFDRTDFLVSYNGAGANFPLPKASDNDGVIFVLKKHHSSAGNPTFTLVDAGDSIDGAATLAVTTCKAVQAYGAGNLWQVIWTA